MKRRTFLQAVTAALCSPFVSKEPAGGFGAVPFDGTDDTVTIDLDHPLNRGLVMWWRLPPAEIDFNRAMQP